jgi:hypothetical protein
MPFYIKHSDGTALVTIADGTIDSTTTDLTLFGKNFPTYGESLNQDLIKLLENFASASQPTHPLNGQLWYDSQNKQLKFYQKSSTGSYWQQLANVSESSGITPTHANQGDLWYDSNSGQLKVYDPNNTITPWVVVGPLTTSNGLLRITGNNPLNIQVGGVTVQSIDALGDVTFPLNPVVQATGRYRYLGDTNNFQTSDITTFYTWVPSSVSINIGSNFVTGSTNTGANGVFTCPTLGIYEVFASVTTLGPVDVGDNLHVGAHALHWWKNQAETGIAAYCQHTNVSNHCLTAHGFIQANAGDTIQLVASTEHYSRISDQNNSYSIRLVG